MIKYCPKCHREAYRLRRENGKVEIVQNGRTVISLGGNSNIGTVSVTCPSGHSVKVVVKEKENDKDRDKG
ncbi:hypothetical protein ES703_21910 [subsurface metagenome]